MLPTLRTAERLRRQVQFQPDSEAFRRISIVRNGGGAGHIFQRQETKKLQARLKALAFLQGLWKDRAYYIGSCTIPQGIWHFYDNNGKDSLKH